MNPLSLALIISVALCTVITQILLKGAGANVSQLIQDYTLGGFGKLISYIFTEPKILIAIALQGFGFILWIIVLSKEQAGLALGLGGASVYLLTAAAEWSIYGTHLSAVKILALILVSAGALLLAGANS